MPQVVSPNAKSKIDYRILLFILVGLIAFQLYLTNLDDEMLVESSVIVISLSGEIGTGFVALLAARHYWNSEVFGRSFLFLSIAFFSVAIGEIIYNVYLFVYDIDPYPSIADVFHFMLYPFSFLHLFLNIRFFTNNQVSFISKVWMVSIAVVITLGYAYSAIMELLSEYPLDLYLGILFVAGAATITSVSIYGARITSKVPLGSAWFLLMIGIFLGTVGDIWYQHLELFLSYETTHIVNLFWYSSYAVIIYALYKHTKAI